MLGALRNSQELLNDVGNKSETAPDIRLKLSNVDSNAHGTA
jgi:hypothetical protein